jgi:hypothetical protein
VARAPRSDPTRAEACVAQLRVVSRACVAEHLLTGSPDRCFSLTWSVARRQSGSLPDRTLPCQPPLADAPNPARDGPRQVSRNWQAKPSRLGPEPCWRRPRRPGPRPCWRTRTCHSHGNPTPDAYRCIAGRRKEPRPIVGLPAAVPLAREADRLAVTVGPGNRHNTRAMRRSFGTGSQRCSRFTAKRMNTVHPDAVGVFSVDSAGPRENDACGPRVERLEHPHRTQCPGGDRRSVASPNAPEAQLARRNHAVGNRRPEPC